MLNGDAFGIDDLKELTADMRFDWEQFGGDTKHEKALALALECARSNRVLELAERMKKARPHLFI